MIIVQIGIYPVSGQMISGGVEASVYGLARELSAGHQVFVMDYPRIGVDDSVEQEESLTVFRFRNRGTHNCDAVGRIREMVERIEALNPSVCHLHGTGFFGARFFDALRARGIPTVLTVHGLEEAERKKTLSVHFSPKALYQYLTQVPAERRLLRAAPEVIVDTEYVARSIRKYRNGTHPAIHVIPQGIDRRFFQLSCPETSATVLSVGAFINRKGHLLLVQAFEKVCRKSADARLVICGSKANGPCYRELADYIARSPFRDRISLRVDLSREELFPLFSQARVFALHSQEESQGIVLAEAMAAGLPVAATRVGGIPDVVTDGITGLLSAYGDIDSFAESIQTLLTSDSRRALMSQACREEAQRYSWSRIAEAVEAVYGSFLSAQQK